MFRSDRLAALMGQRQISQSELARRLNISQASISKLVNGPMQGSKHTHRIARELGTPPAYLMDETDNPDPLHFEDSYSSEEKEWVGILREISAQQRSALLLLGRTIQEQGALLATVSQDQASIKS